MVLKLNQVHYHELARDKTLGNLNAHRLSIVKGHIVHSHGW